MNMLNYFDTNRDIEVIENITPASFIKKSKIANISKRIFLNDVINIPIAIRYNSNKKLVADNRTEAILVIEIHLNKHDNYLMIANIVFRTALCPVLLILKHQNKCRLCACLVRENKLNNNANVMSKPVFSEWQYFNNSENLLEKMLDAISMDKFEGNSIWDLYVYIHTQLEFCRELLLSQNYLEGLFHYLEIDSQLNELYECCTITPKPICTSYTNNSNKVCSYKKNESGYDSNEVWNFLWSNAIVRDLLIDKNIFTIEELLELYEDYLLVKGNDDCFDNDDENFYERVICDYCGQEADKHDGICYFCGRLIGESA